VGFDNLNIHVILVKLFSSFSQLVILATYLYFLLRPPIEFSTFFGFNDIALRSSDADSVINKISY